MLELRGQFASCRVFADHVEQTAIAQIYGFLNCPVFEGAQIRVMPDVHAGAGAVIGFTATLGDRVVPNVIGVDIGCGVQAVPVDDVSDFAAFDAHLRATVPSGFAAREAVHPNLVALYARWFARASWDAFVADVDRLAAKIGTDPAHTWRSLGTLGGGNHFVELDRDEAGRTFLVVHSGSRHFGLRVATHHQKKAIARMGKRGGLEWLEGDDAAEYLADMRVAQRFAMLNRLAMLDALLGFWGGAELRPDDVVTSVHNFIGDDGVIRKGAISAKAGEAVIIPWNMRDGLVLGVGRGNPDWNASAPHGAGRCMGRGEAKRTLRLDDFAATMRDAGVWSSCVGRDTIDEAPAAYKPAGEVEAALAETVEVRARLRPVYNFKAGGE